jgi:hypothetical protein
MIRLLIHSISKYIYFILKIRVSLMLLHIIFENLTLSVYFTYIYSFFIIIIIVIKKIIDVICYLIFVILLMIGKIYK